MTNHRIPQDRINQIARRKLLSLGIATQPNEDKTCLEGRIKIMHPLRLMHPLSSEPIQSLHFSTHNHDQLVIKDPPMFYGLMPQPFYDCASMESLVALLQKSLQQKVDALKVQQIRLNRLGIATAWDNTRVLLLARIEIAGLGIVELEITPKEILATRIFQPYSNQAKPISPIQIELDRFSEKVDLELFLSQAIERGKQVNVNPENTSSPSGLQPTVSRPLTLQDLLQAFGQTVTISTGLSLFKSLRVNDQTCQFVARYEDQDNFSAKLSQDDRILWKGTFKLGDFPGVEDFVAGILGTASVSATPSQDTMGNVIAHEQDLAAGYQIPFHGEFWVMNILVEETSETEVRYVAVDIDGQAFGAPRVLPREVFLNTFSYLSSGSYRLVVRVEQVEPGQVTYVRLDSHREPMGSPIKSRLAVFVSNFVPEAAAF